MSNARELALIEKWADIATTPTPTTLPPLSSPTSPKATKFCCCPNRRRYNLKTAKKSTLHPRNIFIDNDFKYIDDVSQENVSCGSGSRNNSSTCLHNTHNSTTNLAEFEDYYSDYDDIIQVAGNSQYSNKNSNSKQDNSSHCRVNIPKLTSYEKLQMNDQLQHDNSYYLNEHVNQSLNESEGLPTELTKATITAATKEYKSNDEIGAVTNRNANSNLNENNLVLSVQQQQQQQQQQTNKYLQQNYNHNEQHKDKLIQQQQQQQHQQQATIQRLSNSTVSNKQNTTVKNCNCNCYNNNKSNKENNSITAIIGYSNNIINNKSNNNNNTISNYCNNCQPKLNENQFAASVTDEKMTIATTTNVVTNRKRSECGLSTNVVSNSTTTTTTTTTTTSTITATTAVAEPSLPIAATTTTSTTATPTPTTSQLTSTSTATPSPTLVSPLPQTPTTPTKTVIKTVLVKRSPINGTNDMASPATSITTKTTNIVDEKCSHSKNNVASRWETPSSQPRFSVKDRIAAIVAGNEQQKQQEQHDNSIKYKIQCNKNSSSNMTKSTNCAIKATSSQQSQEPQQQQQQQQQQQNVAKSNQLLISNNKCTTSTPTAATPTDTPLATTTQSRAPEKSITDNNNIPLQNKSLQLNDDIKLQRSMLLGNTGCATLPRRRTTNERNCSNSNSNRNNNITNYNDNPNNKYGSNITNTKTAFDKNFLSQNGDKNMSAHEMNAIQVIATTTTLPITKCSSNGKLSALDNLDLALSLDLTDEDGEDPYYALQEYLEKVKHEINEVFELHKARQRMQKEQQQHEQEKNKDEETPTADEEYDDGDGDREDLSTSKSQTATTTMSTLISAAVAAATAKALSSDELTRSIESDSGFDSTSTSGHALNHSSNYNNNAYNSSNKLEANDTTSTTTDNIKSMPTDINSGNELNGSASTIKAAAVPSTTTTTTTPTTTTTKTTKLKALPPPPLLDLNDLNNQQATTTAVMRLRPPHNTTTNNAAIITLGNDDVNIWANKFLRDLDNLMATNKQTTTTTSTASSSASSSPTSKTSPMLLSAAASAAIKSRYGGHRSVVEQRNDPTIAAATNALVLRPEKHATIPLQSFNLDCGRIDSANAATKTNVAYMRTLSAPTTYQQQQQQQRSEQHQQQQRSEEHQENDKKSGYFANSPHGKSNRNSLATFNVVTEQQQEYQRHNQLEQQQQQQHEQQTNFESNKATIMTPTTILKIEETAARGGHQASNEELLKKRQQRQLENDMATIRNALLQQTQQLSAMEAVTTTANEAATAAAYVNSSANMNNKNILVATSTMATSIPKKERINQATTTTTTATVKNFLTSDTTALTTMNTNFTSPITTLLTSSTKMQDCINPMNTSNKDNTNNNNASSSYLLNTNDVTKKGSTSTIWTSEESILRSVGAVDEDNNSTSSSACDEATGVLSSGKSGISLDSSGLDNDNNESGIGTATPPKDMSYWKNIHNDNESVSSLDALRKMKFQKSSSVASSDDPDLLEVLSLCDEAHGSVDADTGDDVLESHDDEQQQQRRQELKEHKQKQKQAHQSRQQKQKLRQHDNDDSNDTLELELNDVVGMPATEEDANDADEDDEGHDEFETIPYCDCDCTDGDVSSTSGNSSNNRAGGLTFDNNIDNNNVAVASVVLRRKCTAAPIMVPYGTQKCRSHSMDTSSLPTSYQHLPYQHHHHQHHPLTRKLQHLQHGRGKERVQLSLALRQEPFQSLLAPTHFHELPSPSSASLHSGHESIGIQELTTKSNSAPLLLKQEKKRDDFAGQKLTLRYSRSQSDRYLAEIEAVEACKWLRAAGFPQYAQMYEDHQFPIDLTNVAKDHTNLENDQLQSLYRRLCILNRCANMRLDQSHKPQTPQQKEDSDDENFALSENWTFQPHIRRWSRIGEMGLELPPATKLNVEKTESSSKESSPDRFEDDDDDDDDQYDTTGAGLSLVLPTGGSGGGDSTDTTLNESAEAAAVRLRRTGSERLKDGAKAFLRRVESIKSRRRKRQNREGIVISGPQALDLSQLGQRHSARKPDAVYSTPPSPSAVSPMHTFPKSPFFGNELKVPSQSDNFLHPNRASPKRTPTTPRSMRTSPLHFFQMPNLKEGKSDDSSSYYSDSQESSAGGKLTFRKTPSKARRFLQRTGKVDDIGTHSDSECHHGRKLLIKDANANNTEVMVKKLQRGGSLNLGKDPKKREGFRSSSFRSRSTTRKETKTDETEIVKRRPVVRWHSFQMEERPHMIFRKCFAQKLDPNSNEHGIPFAAMSAGQLQIIRKLALVILTGYMERYCPTHRSGWNWELPKFIKKIKMPDYRDKKVFGVPLLLILQRTGQTLPIAVRSAFRWLQLNALDQIGLFRKSGVKSRIIKLKELIEYSETAAECMDVFDTQQAYDVADMLKQYFRDLPESLLTTKMSETFAAIFQHLPPEVRLDAVQCAVLLLPDENRETLYALLEFLTLVAANSSYNQMTTNNLAVCLAPSLFHCSIPTTGSPSISASPRRRGKAAGVPDKKELSEAKASHECLSFMIDNYKQIFTASKEKISKCNFGYMEESKPVPLEALGEGMQFHNWRGYLYECTSATIKEGREKTRGWFTIASPNDPQVEIAYKKVGDGHPLRLWRCITEIEGPPKEVLDYIIRQRASWDVSLQQCQTVKKLDERTEIFQYALDGQFTTDFCVLRSWQTDLPRGACVIVETSIDHNKAKPIFGSIRGVVLASRYLIEPCGSGRSRVMHLARVDIKGKTPEWYNKSYGHICSHYLSKIRLAFKNVAEGPESKV